MTKQTLKPAFNVLAIFVLALAMTLQAFFVPNASAAQITERKLTLQAGTDGADTDTIPDGGAQAGGNANHEFDFKLPTAGTLASIKFEYCTTAAPSTTTPGCVTPTGVDVTGASLGNESTGGGFVSGFSFVNITGTADTNDFYLTRASSAITANDRAVLRIDTVVNPTTVGTFFVRITTYASADTTGGSTDTGTVAASIADQIVLDGTMPESLVFCAGETIFTTSSVPDCGHVNNTDGVITYNDLFSPTKTAIAFSQMAASTNAGLGYVITINGPTLTSGSNTIAGISGASGSASNVGNAQFGLNVVANATNAITFPGTNNSADVVQTSNGTNFNGRPTTGYDTADTFKFVSGNVVADSDFANDGTPAPTDAQIFTVSYIANVPGSQPAGTYTTTLTYICTPTF